MKTKVLLIRDNSLLNGGIQKHCKDLYDLFYKDENIQICEIVNLPTTYIPFVCKSIVNMSVLYKHIKSSNCDVVHIHGFMSLLIIQAFITSKLLKKKIIYSPHFHPFKYLRRPILGKMYFYFVLSFFLPFIDKIVTINNEDTAFFKRYNKIVIRIPHWFNNTCDALKKQSIHKTKMLLFVGRNESNKGLEHLYQLPTDIYEVHCVTNGKLLRSDFIHHTGLTNEDLANLYNQVSVVVIPSRYEAFSLVALEALSHHVPIVISNRVRIGDYLTENAGCYIFQYHNYSDFQKKIDEALLAENIDYTSLLLPFKKDAIKNKYKNVYID